MGGERHRSVGMEWGTSPFSEWGAGQLGEGDGQLRV